MSWSISVKTVGSKYSLPVPSLPLPLSTAEVSNTNTSGTTERIEEESIPEDTIQSTSTVPAVPAPASTSATPLTAAKDEDDENEDGKPSAVTSTAIPTTTATTTPPAAHVHCPPEFKIRINPHDTMQHFQYLIHLKTRLPLDRQRLIYRGRLISVDQDGTSADGDAELPHASGAEGDFTDGRSAVEPSADMDENDSHDNGSSSSSLNDDDNPEQQQHPKRQKSNEREPIKLCDVDGLSDGSCVHLVPRPPKPTDTTTTASTATTTRLPTSPTPSYSPRNWIADRHCCFPP
mmetsp:Transcript_43865/g.51365  ORF Transcript_43865/g.51365 Transcript_43865/m.51365 type:complete len:290 (+) Transcript_43865:200-1069(+)